ncbi:RNA polymerase subunit sigma-24 [Effusibacillus dendaii]|uniref:Uncharacterized protein n=1 Tax=Effusibacillus dendaii TaxID=2743772 RepID=A0A7I8DCA9_9BACL|nr:RNA polymerase subunit sigma-24 [Effusibacillus dendaii]BCJ86466.1 hypothetical protein skT53_14510 [Effusibacillus dendaii]
MQAVQDNYDRIEAQVIEQLSEYNTIVGRIKILEKYPIGNGLYLTEPYSEDDKLQALHKQLKGLPSHMYLSRREQKLESVANAYITRHPAGTKSQLYEVKSVRTLDDDDKKLLKELGSKIEKVIDARHGTVDGYEGALQRVAELQELQQKKEWIDDILKTMAEYKPHYSELLILRYIQCKDVEAVCNQIPTSRANYKRWRPMAIKEYAKLAGIE